MNFNQAKNSIGKAGSMFNLPQPEANITAFLKLGRGSEYEISYFKIGFSQPVDHKGEPQGEVIGGQITVAVTQVIADDIFGWAVRPNDCKNGSVEFKVQNASAPMKIQFNNAYCVNFEQKMSPVDAMGVQTTFTISAEEVIINGIDINKFWKK